MWPGLPAWREGRQISIRPRYFYFPSNILHRDIDSIGIFLLKHCLTYLTFADSDVVSASILGWRILGPFETCGPVARAG